jgi:hypothetical protein
MSCTYRSTFIAAGLLAAAFVSGPAFAAATIGTCSPSRVKFLASDVAFFTTSSTTFVNVAQGAVKFTQGGTQPSCVIVSLSANSFAVGNSPATPAPLTVRIMMDGTTPALPNEVDFSDGNDGGNQARAFDFIFPSVAPGEHTIRVQIKTNSDSLSADLNRHNIVVQFAP